MNKKSRNSVYNLHTYFHCFTDGIDYDDNLLFVTRGDEHEGNKFGVLLPQTPDWCHTCDGTGGRSRYDVDGYDIDAMIGMDDDGSFREDYFSGKTDVPCDCCGGSGVVFIIDYDKLSDGQKAILEIDARGHESDADARAESDAERRMGA